MGISLQVFDPIDMKKPVDRQKLAEYENILRVALDGLENIWLKDTPYICSNEISIADLACICELMQVRLIIFFNVIS